MPAYGGLWDGIYAQPYALQVNRSPITRRVSQALRRPSMRKYKEVLDTVVNGSSINGAAAVTHKRIAGDPLPGDPVVGGGRRTIDVVTDIGAGAVVGTLVVSAAQIDALVDFQSAPGTAAAGVTTPNYPADKSGNGGGGKLTATYPVHA